MSTSELLRLYTRQLEDQHAPQNLTIGMREAADQMDQQRETTLQLLGQVGQLSDEIERLRAALRSVMDDLERLEKNHWLPVGMLDDVIYVNARAALEGPQDRMAKPLEGE